MPIDPLPRSTIRLIGSSQVLTDPSSVVKELVDNALDARATAVFIEIAANTLDTISVRDNGHGVASSDRPALCRPHCTSKLHDFSELHSVGGKWLGFRGEALSCLAELSGSLAIATRVEGEEVAVSLKFDRKGEICWEGNVSQPVGTVVKVSNLFEFVPVRKQTALKSASKCLAKIKGTLRAYAFTRPTIKIGLRVQKAKNENGGWVYPGQPQSSVEDAALQIVGRECASQCVWSTVECHGFEVQAFLPRADSIASKLSNAGHFVSIDNRPVSTQQGTLKRIRTLCKEKIRCCNSSFKDAKDPFLFLNINCPPESYDPNVEPAKDDVLFDDRSRVMSAVEALLQHCYPQEEEQGAKEQTDDQFPAIAQPSGTDDALDEVSEIGVPAGPSNDTNPLGLDVDDSLAMFDNVEDIDIEDDPHGVQVFNPWTIAKINTSKSSPTLADFRNGSRNILPSSSPIRLAKEARTPCQLLPTPFPSSPVRESEKQGGWPTPTLTQSPSCSEIPRSSDDTGSLFLTTVRNQRTSPDKMHSNDNGRSASSATARLDNVDRQTPAQPSPALPSPPQTRNVHKGRDTDKPFTSPLKRVSQPCDGISAENSQSKRQQRTLKSVPTQGSARPPQRRRALDDEDELLSNLASTNNGDIRHFLGGPCRSHDRTTGTASHGFLAINSQNQNHHLSRISNPESMPPYTTQDETPGSDSAEELFESYAGTQGSPTRHLQRNNRSQVPPSLGSIIGVNEAGKKSGRPANNEQSESSGGPRTRARTRTKSLNLPLERIPANSRMQNVVLKWTMPMDILPTPFRHPHFSTKLVSEEQMTCDPFTQVDAAVADAWSRQLRHLLNRKWSEGELIGDVEKCLKAALCCRGALVPED